MAHKETFPHQIVRRYVVITFRRKYFLICQLSESVLPPVCQTSWPSPLLVSLFVFVCVFVFFLSFLFVFALNFLTIVFTPSLPDLVALASPEPELPTLHLDLSSDPLEVSNQPLSSTVIHCYPLSSTVIHCELFLCDPLDLDSYPLEVSYFLLVGFPLLASDSQLMWESTYRHIHPRKMFLKNVTSEVTTKSSKNEQRRTYHATLACSYLDWM